VVPGSRPFLGLAVLASPLVYASEGLGATRTFTARVLT
jgi:hypothetical protein